MKWDNGGGVQTQSFTSTKESKYHLNIFTTALLSAGVTYFWLLSPQMAVARTDSTDITGGNSCSPKTEYISIMQTINTNHAPQIMCNCGRPSEHSLKRGLLFSNVLILREITLFLGFKDLVAFKDAFFNYTCIEIFIHNLVCIRKPFGFNTGCNCIHRAQIITIWIEKSKKITQKKIQKSTKIQKNPKKSHKSKRKYKVQNIFCTNLHVAMGLVSMNRFYGCNPIFEATGQRWKL